MENYLTIKEFTKKVGISPQAVYKELKKSNNKYKPFIKLKNKKKYLHKDALKLFENKDNLKNSKPVEQPIGNQLNKYSEEFVKQILDENKYLREQLNLAQINLQREQELHHDTQTKLLVEQPDRAEQPVENNSKKSSWFKRFFK